MEWSYILKHWGGTLLLPAVFLTIYAGIESKDIIDNLFLFPYFLIIAAIYSLPTLLVYILAFYLLNRYKVDLRLAKLILIIITVVGICVTSYLISKTMSLEFVITYCVSTTLCGVFFKFKKT